jgi:hypothetical protein
LIAPSAATAIFDGIRLKSVRIGENSRKHLGFQPILTLSNRIPSNTAVAVDRAIKTEYISLE